MTAPDTLQQKPNYEPNQRSESYQQTLLAIDNFNGSLVKLVEALKDMNKNEIISIAAKFNMVSKNIAFISQYFEAITLEKSTTLHF